MDGVKYAYDTAAVNSGDRPNIITLNGWAGTQRYGGIWTGDQYGGSWDCIRYHIPTFIGQSLSGNPNCSSDMDGIFGGHPIIATRDYQWKSFTGAMLGMDGWGSYVKMPYAYGDPYTGINRLYLKLKTQLMPYIYTSAASASNIDTGNGDTGLPYARAMMFSDDSAYANSEATQYQFTLGEDILVAPIYQNTKAGDTSIGDGDDIRNGIYLPGTDSDIWIDYWTGDQYRGGQVINNFDAPLWKLPVFVKANAILPMWEANNNPQPKSEKNPGGADRTKRIVEFFATTGNNEYTQYEDDGNFIAGATDESDAEYGKETVISYGDHVSTRYTSAVSGEAGNATAVFTAEKLTGSYTGYDPNRDTTFVVSVSKEPSKIVAKNGDAELAVTKVASKAEFDQTEARAGKAVVFYDEAPNMNSNASSPDEQVRNEAFSKTEITHSPKLYVKFAKTNVQDGAQSLELSGFENSVNLGGNQLVEDLAVPTFLEEGEWVVEPYAITAKWNTVETATSYDLKIDGTIANVGASDFTKVDSLMPNSTHTFQIRSRNSEGYSNWSEEIRVTTALDPWRNTPVPEKTEWEGDYYNNQKEDIAFDHDLSNSHFHSGGNDIGKALTLDYGKCYQFEALRYWPRTDAGNGTVTKMRVETSLDGNAWTSQEVSWSRDGEMKTADLGKVSARFVRLTPLESVGGFFSAREIAVDIVDGTKGFVLGDYTGDGKVDDNDKTLAQALGLENRANKSGLFNSHVAGHNVDINGNGIYDAYDISWTLSQLGGGTKQKGAVSGGLAVVPSQTEVKAGDKVTVDVYASDLQNVNALGAVVHFDDRMFSYDNGGLALSPAVGSMADYSKVMTDFDDHVQSVNIAVGNEGDGKLLSGSTAVASFTLIAKADGKVDLSGFTYLVGPKQDVIEGEIGGEVVLPEVPGSQPAEYAQGDFDIRVTNDALPTDDGSNVGKIIQGGSYDSLFDNVKHHDGGSGSGTFELKWATETPEVSVPLDLHFDFKTPSTLDNVVLYNRQDADGNVSGNGVLTKVGATVRFEDGTTQEFSGGAFDAQSATWTFKLDEANTPKPVAGVDVHVKETTSPHMMTISEIDFNYTTPGAKIDEVRLDENNATSIYVGDLAPVNATVLPGGAYPYIKAESDNSEVVSIVQTQSGDTVTTLARGNKAGTATITVSSVADPTKSAQYTIEVKEGVDLSALREAISAAKGYAESAYTAESFGELAKALGAAEALIAKPQEEITKTEVDKATVALAKAIEGLQMRPVDEGKLINRDAASGVSVVAASSSAAESPFEGAMDYDESTIWHSSYNGDHKLPQYIVFDLGKTYDLTDVTFLPRQNGQVNGDIFEAQVYVADSIEELQGDSFSGIPVGTFKFKNDGSKLDNRTAYQQMAFGAVSARYVKIVATRSGGDQIDAHCSIAETKFYGDEHVDPSGVDKTGLSALVEKILGENLKAGDYTEASWKPFELALGDAQRILEDAQATQEEVNGALTKLQEARDGLVKTEVPPVENPTRDQLTELLGKAKALDTTGMTADSVQALKDAIAYASQVLGDEAASDAAIRAAYDQLKLAIEGLTPEQGNPGGNPGGGQGGDGGDRGNGGDRGGLVQTGDTGMWAAVSTGIAGVIAAVTGLFIRKRRER